MLPAPGGKHKKQGPVEDTRGLKLPALGGKHNETRREMLPAQRKHQFTQKRPQPESRLHGGIWEEGGGDRSRQESQIEVAEQTAEQTPKTVRCHRHLGLEGLLDAVPSAPREGTPYKCG